MATTSRTMDYVFVCNDRFASIVSRSLYSTFSNAPYYSSWIQSFSVRRVGNETFVRERCLLRFVVRGSVASSYSMMKSMSVAGSRRPQSIPNAPTTDRVRVPKIEWSHQSQTLTKRLEEIFPASGGLANAERVACWRGLSSVFLISLARPSRSNRTDLPICPGRTSGHFEPEQEHGGLSFWHCELYALFVKRQFVARRDTPKRAVAE